ncbi:GNAT family N-acetyltransferase [Streptomyces sp. MUM 203J]|uniref:GNAT family N-acetyltransferase n=1 Tax=Streptomyces sp. MUM 203J TaxID=2791990 RepID=UPI001F040D5D|nr:GNAT family N-acetyltransferase [Streptomyces sp. MUM 203J]MCH0540539.1 GNAT family N-acetyltransferase [Streptomyces sp. MUM 203J]
MTTTLRPTGPLQQSADGTLSRAYEVCVNSRPVGAVRVATAPGFGRALGTISDLRIDDADRRRGRGTVAALAAEEVLRGWRCRLVRVSVPAEAAVALRLATALGYTERGRTMTRALAEGAAPGEPGAPGQETAVRPMRDEEYEPWWTAAEDAYVRVWGARGIAGDTARAKARADRARLLPDGLASRGTRLYVAEAADGAPVGHLWLGLGPAAYVWDVEMAAGRRGEGHGRALMRHAERTAREAGADTISLHVFSDNTPALRLYESLGYRTTHIQLDKRLY